MTPQNAPSPVRSAHAWRHITRVLIAVAAVTYSAVAATSAASIVDHRDATGDMDVAVHWHGNAPHPHVVAVAKQDGGAHVKSQVASFRTPDVAQTTGTHRALVINLVRADGLVAPRDVVTARYLEAAAGMYAMSRGLLTISVDLFGHDIAVPYTTDICNLTSTFTQPVLDEVSREISTNGYRFISFVLPVRFADQCRFSGLGQVHGMLTWNAAYMDWSAQSQPSANVVMHEWGHNLGLWHSNYLQCSVGGQPIALAARADRAAGACKRHEYGGEWSVMGSGFGSIITAGERRHLGWLRDGEQTSVSEASVTLGVDGPISMVWLQNAEGDLFQVEFVRSDTSPRWTRDYLSGSYLQNVPRDAGVLVKFVERANTSDTDYVLDTNPHTGALLDAPVKAMQSWSDATGSVTVTVLSITNDSATVHLKGISVAPSAVNLTKVAPRADIGAVDLVWEAAPSALRVARYEVIVYEGAEQREMHVVTADGLRNAVQIPNAARGNDYWVAVRAINELGVAGPVSAVSPVRWDGARKPVAGTTGKPCTGKRPSKRCR